MLNLWPRFVIHFGRKGKYYLVYYGSEKAARRFVIKMQQKMTTFGKQITYHSQSDSAGHRHNIKVIIP